MRAGPQHPGMGRFSPKTGTFFPLSWFGLARTEPFFPLIAPLLLLLLKLGSFPATLGPSSIKLARFLLKGGSLSSAGDHPLPRDGSFTLNPSRSLPVWVQFPPKPVLSPHIGPPNWGCPPPKRGPSHLAGQSREGGGEEGPGGAAVEPLRRPRGTAEREEADEGNAGTQAHTRGEKKKASFRVKDLKAKHFSPLPPPSVQAAEAQRRREAAREAAVGQRRSLGGLQEDALRRQRDFEHKVSRGPFPPSSSPSPLFPPRFDMSRYF